MSKITQCVNQDYAETEVGSRTFIYTWKIKSFTLYRSLASTPLISKSSRVNGNSLWEIKLDTEDSNSLPENNSSTKTDFDMHVQFYVPSDLDVKPYKNSQYYLYFVARIIGKEGKYYQAHKESYAPLFLMGYIHTFKFSVQEEIVLNENNGWLVDGDLTFRFEISIATGEVINRHQTSYFDLGVNNKPSFIGFESILNDKKFSDIKIVIDDKEFYVYKGILATQSPVFAAMFEHEMKESIENVIQVVDVDYKVMQEVLRFIYAGKVNNIKNIARDLLAAADKYEIEELKLQCEKILVNDLKVETVSSLLIYAEKYRAMVLKKSALEFFRLHVKEIIQNEKYKAEVNSLLPLFPEILKFLVF